MKCKYFGCKDCVAKKKSTKKMKRKIVKYEIYCKKHLVIARKLDEIVNSKKERECLYPGCSKILSQYNRNYFCFHHCKKVTFEREGLDYEEKEVQLGEHSLSQWDAMVEKII